MRYDYLPSLCLFYLNSQDPEQLGVSYYDLRNKGDQITSRDLKGTRLPPSSASFRIVMELYGLHNHPFFGLRNVTELYGLCINTSFWLSACHRTSRIGNNTFFWLPACHGTSQIEQQYFLLTFGMSRNFTNCLTMGAKYLEVIKWGLHPNKWMVPGRN